MVNPSELLRTNSAFNDDDDNNGDEGGFVAPIEDYRNIVDCGCTALLPCLNEKFNLERFAKPKFFLIVLSIIGVFSGIVLEYFRGTSQIWSLHYQIEQDTIDWLIYINEVFVGFFALIIAYWGNRMHRPKWLGAITIYLAVSCLFLAILEFFQPVKENETDIDVINGHTLCQRIKNMNKSMGNLNLSENSNFNNNDQYVVPFVLILLYQFTFALFSITFLTHGISYIDDSLSSSYAPISIALIFTFNRMGMQSGIFAAWMPYMYSRKSIFFSILWLFVASLLLVTGCIIAMFPKNMPNILLKKSVNSLLNIASGGNNNASSSSVIELNQKNVDGFFISILRLLKNKILLLVILTETLMQSAIINFQIKEKHINQEKYHIPKFNDNSGYSDPTLIQFTNTVLKQPLIGISYIAVGLVLAKIQPKPKLILIWNLKAYLAVLVSFVLTRFFSCTNSKIQNNGKFEIFSYCSWNCGCSLDGPFQPVCLNTKTYFSPCAAGCTEFNSALRIYRNCSCGFPHNNNNNNNITDAAEAANGSCDADSCNTLWVFVQVHAVFSAALLASTFINSLFIILRCVARKDKALALGLYLSFVSLLPYLPIRLIYNAITDNFCQIFGTKTCQIYSAQFSLYTSIITICIKFLAIISCIGLSFIIGDLELYKISSNNSNKGGSQQENLNEENLYIGTSPSTVGEEVPNAENTNLIHQTDGLRNNNKQQSESDLNTLEGGSMKNERINTYLSEGALVPPLKNKMLTSTKSGSKNSNSNKSVLTSSSLSGIADEIGDDHDSDVSSFQRPQKVKLLEEKLRHDPSSPSSSVNNKEKIEETQF